MFFSHWAQNCSCCPCIQRLGQIFCSLVAVFQQYQSKLCYIIIIYYILLCYIQKWTNSVCLAFIMHINLSSPRQVISSFLHVTSDDDSTFCIHCSCIKKCKNQLFDCFVALIKCVFQYKPPTSTQNFSFYWLEDFHAFLRQINFYSYTKAMSCNGIAYQLELKWS